LIILGYRQTAIEFTFPHPVTTVVERGPGLISGVGGSPGEGKKCFTWSEKHFIAGHFKLPNSGIFFYETGSRLLRYINGSLSALSVVK